MQHEVMVLSKRMHERMFRQKICAGRQHNRSEWRRRDFCHFQCKCLCAEALLHAELSSSMQEVERNIECMHIFAYNEQRAVLKSAACRLQAAVLYQNRRPHISVQEKKLALPGHCGFDSYSNKDAMSFVTWKTIPKQLGEFVLIFLPSRYCAEFSESPVN